VFRSVESNKIGTIDAKKIAAEPSGRKVKPRTLECLVEMHGGSNKYQRPGAVRKASQRIEAISPNECKFSDGME